MIKKLFIAVCIALALIILIPLAISFYLSPQNELKKTDAIVVISGGDTDARVSEGVKLYLQKWAPKIIFSGAAASGDVSNALAMKRIAIRKGVESESILIEEDSKTTNQNAEYVSELIKTNDIKSIILITSPYHQRRAFSDFKTVLGKDFVIINHSAKDQTWAKKNWWENANARFLTFGEILKNFYGLFL